MKTALYKATSLAALWLILPLLAMGQTPVEEVHYSPYQVVYNHLYYLQTDSYNAARSAESFPGTDEKQRIKSAIRLKQILDGKGLYVDMNALPDEPVLADSLPQRTYTLFRSEPRIYLEKTRDGWYYSRATVEQIPKMHREVYPLGTGLSRHFTGEKWNRTVLGIKAWQWLGFLGLLLVAGIVFKLLSLLIRFLIPRISAIPFIYSDQEIGSVARAARSASLFFTARIVILLLPLLMLSPKLSFYFVRSLRILSAFFLILLLFHIADLIMIYLTRAAEKTANTLDDQVIPVARRLAKGLVLLGGGIYILHLLDVNVTALLAGISIGGLALALAAQDTVKNLIGSVVIFIDRPFQIGDWIHFDTIDGTVEEVGIRSTRIRTFANSVTSVPNGKLADMVVDNLGARVYRRFKTEIGVTYDTPPHLIEAFIHGIREMILAHPYSRKDALEVHLNSFGSTSLNILVYMFFQVPTWKEELSGRHELMLGIIYLAERLGVRFAFPTSTIHIEEMPGQKSLAPEYVRSADEADRRMRAYLEEFRNRVDRPQKPPGDEAED